jgi:hypothetical protein
VLCFLFSLLFFWPVLLPLRLMPRVIATAGIAITIVIARGDSLIL